MTSELVVECVRVQRPSLVEKSMSDKGVIDVTEINPDSSGTRPGMTTERLQGRRGRGRPAATHPAAPHRRNFSALEYFFSSSRTSSMKSRAMPGSDLSPRTTAQATTVVTGRKGRVTMLRLLA